MKSVNECIQPDCPTNFCVFKQLMLDYIYCFSLYLPINRKSAKEFSAIGDELLGNIFS